MLIRLIERGHFMQIKANIYVDYWTSMFHADYGKYFMLIIGRTCFMLIIASILCCIDYQL